MKRFAILVVACLGLVAGWAAAGPFSAGAGHEWSWPSAPGVIRVDAYKPEITMGLQGEPPAVRLWVDGTGRGHIEVNGEKVEP